MSIDNNNVIKEPTTFTTNYNLSTSKRTLLLISYDLTLLKMLLNLDFYMFPVKLENYFSLNLEIIIDDIASLHITYFYPRSW